MDRFVTDNLDILTASRPDMQKTHNPNSNPPNPNPALQFRPQEPQAFLPNPFNKTKDELFKKIISNPQNVLTQHEIDAYKNPVVDTGIQFPIHHGVEIATIKEDKSLFDRDLDNPDKIKRRRRRSQMKNRSKMV